MERLLILLVLFITASCGPKLVNKAQYKKDVKHDKQQHKMLKKRGVY